MIRRAFLVLLLFLSLAVLGCGSGSSRPVNKNADRPVSDSQDKR